MVVQWAQVLVCWVCVEIGVEYIEGFHAHTYTSYTQTHALVVHGFEVPPQVLEIIHQGLIPLVCFLGLPVGRMGMISWNIYNKKCRHC